MARTLPKLIVLFYVLFVCKCVCTVLLPPGVNQNAVNKLSIPGPTHLVAMATSICGALNVELHVTLLVPRILR